MATDIVASAFEERAENLSRNELSTWTSYTPKDIGIIKKLKGPGAKLLTGPRGSGKSTLLKTAYYELLDSREAFPLYVNYSLSMALEPMFHQRADATESFRQWVLCKILLGARQSFIDVKRPIPKPFELTATKAQNFIRALEKGASADEFSLLYSPSEVIEVLNVLADDFGAERCVVLMDDAAHAFSQEQQHVFFEVFRELRTRWLACKAAVYPGITTYSPNVHVGHEAELIEAWSQPDDDNYRNGMRQMVSRRLPAEMLALLRGRDEIIDFLALSAFGIPRAFINMLADVFDVDAGEAQKPTRLRAERAVATQADEIRGVFRSLRRKIPRYSKFVDVGEKLERAILSMLSKFNSGISAASRKAKVIAIEEPIPTPAMKILNMLEYAGIIRPAGAVSRGRNRYIRYVVHFSLIISSNALRLGKSYALESVVEALLATNSNALARSKVAGLLGAGFEAQCVLQLPVCPRCNAARVQEDQSFCIKCGQELTNVSVYNELLRAPISELNLPQKKIEGIARLTKLSTIQDIILDDDHAQLRKVPFIGPIWAKKIRTAAQEYVSV